MASNMLSNIWHQTSNSTAQAEFVKIETPKRLAISRTKNTRSPGPPYRHGSLFDHHSSALLPWSVTAMLANTASLPRHAGLCRAHRRSVPLPRQAGRSLIYHASPLSLYHNSKLSTHCRECSAPLSHADIEHSPRLPRCPLSSTTLALRRSPSLRSIHLFMTLSGRRGARRRRVGAVAVVTAAAVLWFCCGGGRGRTCDYRRDCGTSVAEH